MADTAAATTIIAAAALAALHRHAIWMTKSRSKHHAQLIDGDTKHIFQRSSLDWVPLLVLPSQNTMQTLPNSFGLKYSSGSAHARGQRPKQFQHPKVTGALSLQRFIQHINN
jgi:protein-disulfide isomerase-like protein with CxxC motif